MFMVLYGGAVPSSKWESESSLRQLSFGPASLWPMPLVMLRQRRRDNAAHPLA